MTKLFSDMFLAKTICMFGLYLIFEQTITTAVSHESHVLNEEIEEDIMNLTLDVLEVWDLRIPLMIIDYLGVNKVKLHKRISDRNMFLASITMSDKSSSCATYVNYNTKNMVVFLFGVKDQLRRALLEVSNAGLLRPPLRFIVICYSCGQIQDLDFTSLNGFFVFVSTWMNFTTNRLDFHIQDVHCHSSTNFVHLKSLGSWNSNDRFTLTNSAGQVPSFGLQGDLNGVTLRAKVLSSQLRSDKHYSQDAIKYVDDINHKIHVLDALANTLNFKYEITVKPKTSYGNLLKNGTFTGSIGSFISDNTVDIFAHDVMMTADRTKVLDMLFPIHFTHLGVFYKKPRLVADGSLVIYVRPFSSFSWTLLGVTLFSYFSTLVFFDWMYHDTFAPRQFLYAVGDYGGGGGQFAWKRSKKHDFQFALSESFQTLVGILCGQGLEAKMKNSALIVYFTFGLCVVIVMGFYTAVLSSSFTLMSQAVSFRNLRSITENPYYEIGAVDSVLEMLQAHADYPTLVAKMATGQHHCSVISGETYKAIQKVLEEKFVLIDFDHLLDQVPDVCQITFMRFPNFAFRTRHWSCKKHSPYSHILSERLGKMRETGLLNHMEDRYFKTIRTLNKCPEEERDTSVLTLPQVQFIFWIIVVGIVTAAFALFCENIFGLHCNEKN